MAELALFLSGSLAYRFYTTRRVQIQAVERRKLVAATLVIWTLTVVFSLVFEATRLWKIDRRLGELSYPTYVGHVLMLKVFYGVVARSV